MLKSQNSFKKKKLLTCSLWEKNGWFPYIVREINSAMGNMEWPPDSWCGFQSTKQILV